MAAQTEHLRISQVGLAARSPEGHAAKGGMAIKGNEDMWVHIQENTFRNWVNEHLKTTGLVVRDLASDFSDGTKLVALVEILQKRQLKHNRRPANPHQYLENVTTALNAISADGVKLVNIGNVDIVNGNLKLILGLIWSLIVRYQIGRSKFPPKKLMLAWLKAVLPECRVTNFTTDWSSGVYLSALLDYCKPGLYPHWRTLDEFDGVNNCRTAMEIARREFNIPIVLEPEYLASPHLDELSGMTYLSYFMKENSPGYHATLRWVKSQIPESNVKNFTKDWNSGLVLCDLVRSLGGPIPGYKQLTTEQSSWESNQNLGIKGAQKLGVEPILKGKDMADQNVEHLGVMAYAAYFQWIRPRQQPSERLAAHWNAHTSRVNRSAQFKIECLEGDVSPQDVVVEVMGPSGKVDCRFSMNATSGQGSIMPVEIGMYQLFVYCEGEIIQGCPTSLRVTPEMTKISYPGMEPCAIGSIVEVLVNSNGANAGQIDVIARSPTGRELNCPVNENDGVYTANFQPDEAGEWSISITHAGEYIQGGPFTCFVYDPNGIKLSGLDGGQPGQSHSFIVDTTATGGLGDVVLDIVLSGRSIPHQVEELGRNRYKVTFLPANSGKYKIYVYFNGTEIRGSAFSMRVGSYRSKHQSRHTEHHRSEHHIMSGSLNNRNPQKNVEYNRVNYTTSSSSPSYWNTNNNTPTTTTQYNNNHNSNNINSTSYYNNGHHHNNNLTNESSTSWRRNVALHLGQGENLRATSPLTRAMSPTLKQNVTTTTMTTTTSRNDYLRSPSPLRAISPQPPPTATKFSTTHLTTSSSRNDYSYRSPSPIRPTSPPAVKIIPATPLVASPLRADYFNDSGNKVERTIITERRTVHESGRLLQSSPSPVPNGRNNGGASPTVFTTTYRTTLTPSPSPMDQVKRVDTTSNVRVSSMLNNLNQRRDSWDAIAKTKSLLSYGSLESLANLTAAEKTESRYTTSSVQQQQHTETSNNYNMTSNNYNITSNNRSSPIRSSPISGGNTVANQVIASGDSLKLIAVHRQATVKLQTPGLDPMDITATVRSPSMKNIPCSVARSRTDDLTLFFTPTEIGEYWIDLKVGENRIPGAPFRTHAYNSQAIQVGRIPDGVIGKPVEFEIDGSKAGSGNLEILVNGGHVTSFVRDLGNQRFLASFVPHEPGAHLVEMAFNNEQVPGSPWQVGVMAATASSPSSGGVITSSSVSMLQQQQQSSSSTSTAKMSVLGDAVRLVSCGSSAAFELSASGFNRDDIDVQIISPSKRPVSSRLTEQGSGNFRVQFTPKEVGSHLVEVSIGGRSMPGGPLVAKVYNAALIRVSDVGSGVVGQPCQFRVDASQAGEGQLEISVNEGEVPNHVAVVGGGRCLVSFTPESAKPHLIDIKFNGETVPGCPFVCPVSDTSRVTLTLRNLELIPVNESARFHIAVDGSGSAELSVSVRGPSSELPVKVTGNVPTGFTAEFTPREVGGHSVTVEYNGHPVAGTPFIAKAYDSKKVFVGPVPRGSVGKPLQFTVDASSAGEGNLEITISARGHNIPTQVHPQGNARFAVSFIPLEATDHVISINFNKAAVPGSPFTARVVADPHHIIVSGQNLSSAAVGKPAHFSLSNVSATLDEIEVNVEGPNGQSLAAQVKDNGSQTFRIEFNPRVAGEHRISVSVAGQPVAGSPFACKAYDVKAIKVKESNKGSVGRPVTYLVETSQAGPGNLEVTVNGGRVPTSAQAQGPHTYAISFTPREATPHTVELRFNGEDVPGSPFTTDIVEAARVIPGPEEKVPVGKTAQFYVQAAATQGKPTVTVLSPSRRNLPVDLADPNNNQISVTFSPDEVGDHSIEVKLNDNHVEGSPFLLKAYDSNKVKVTDVQSGVVGKPVFFSINASQAGAGNLEIIVSVNGRNVPNYVQSEGNARFRVNFKPQEAAAHLLSVRFNGELVPGSPFTCRILDAGQVLVSGSALRQAPISRPALLTIDPQGAQVQECVVTVLAPSGQNVPTVVSGNAKDKFVATFTPFEVGRHAVSIVMDSEHVKGSPFASNVYDINQVKISGLPKTNTVGHPVTFAVDAAEAGEGTLELVVSTDHGTVKAEVAACSRGLYQVTFVPLRPDPHYVHISFNEDDIPGSPFKCDIMSGGGGEGAARMAMKNLAIKGEGLHQAVVGAPAYFDVDPGGQYDETNVEVEIMGPDGSDTPVRMLKTSGGRFRAEYRPIHVGAHQVWVRKGGVTVEDCPYEVEVFDPSQASITHVTEAICNQPANFTIDMSKAGRGILTVSIKAAGREIKTAVRDIGHGRHEVSFLPTLATPHRVDGRLNGLHIGGCPLDIAVRDSVSGKEIIASGPGLYQAEAGREANFTIETLGHHAREFDVVVSGPGSIAVPVRCYQQKDGNLLAQFTPPGAGTYKVEVLHGAKPLKCSPFFCQCYDASRVRLQGLGNKSVAVHDPITFYVQRKGAGFAELDVTVTSPLGQNLPLAVRSGEQPESDLIEFKPSLPGQYRFIIKYGGKEVPGSPVTFIVGEEGSVLQNRDSVDSASVMNSKAQTNGTSDVYVSGPGLEGSRVGKETYFTIDAANVGSGKPEATLIGDGGNIPVHIIEESRGVYKAMFTANDSGNYKLFIKHAGKEIRGSPFSILVSAVADASRVICSGEGLRLGTVGKEIRSFIDTRRAGPGELTAQCVGPNKVAYCELYDHGDGTFTLNVKPQEAGKHALSIKYGGQHVPGSPFTLRVAGAPDASKVKVFGPGIEHGVLATFQSRFICDTRGAGAGQLTVRIRGPKGAFRVEMQRESQRDRAILCKYEPTEPGDYRLEVKWSGQHVPGSPFSVMIFDTMEELQKFVQGNNSPPGGPALSELYGSVGYSTGYANMNFTQPSWRGSQAQL